MENETVPPTIRLLLEARAEITIDNWMIVNFVAGMPEGEMLEFAMNQAKIEIDEYFAEHPEASTD